MKKLLCCAAVVLALNLVAGEATLGQNPAQKKKVMPTVEEPTAQDYAYVIQAKEAIGILTYLDLGAGKMTLKIDFPKIVPNTVVAKGKNANAQQQQILRAQQQVMRDYQSIMTVRNPVQYQQRMQKLMLDIQNLQIKMAQAGNTANLFKTVYVSKEFECDIIMEPRVARAELAQEYDEKGNTVTYTKEELKKKEDKVIGGYTAKVEDLAPGQKVHVYFTKPPTKKKTTGDKVDTETPKVGEGDKKDGEAEAKPGTKGTIPGDRTTQEPRPLVRAFLILAEPDPSTLPKNADKKKKKKNNN